MTSGDRTGQIEALLIDIDGTLSFAGQAIPGAAEVIAALRRARVPFRFVTNATRKPRSAIVADLRDLGIEVTPAECFTAPVVAVAWLRARGARRVSLYLPEVTTVDLAGFEVDDGSPEYLVVGHLGEGWTYEVLDRAFHALLQGAELVALQRNRSWDPGDGRLHLDAGPFIAALEYATSTPAHLIGKPSRAFFELPAADLGVPLDRTAMVGDSLEGDVAGAQAAGCTGILVRTGSFRTSELERAEVVPDAVIDSIADLPQWLGL